FSDTSPHPSCCRTQQNSAPLHEIRKAKGWPPPRTRRLRDEFSDTSSPGTSSPIPCPPGPPGPVGKGEGGPNARRPHGGDLSPHRSADGEPRAAELADEHQMLADLELTLRVGDPFSVHLHRSLGDEAPRLAEGADQLAIEQRTHQRHGDSPRPDD